MHQRLLRRALSGAVVLTLLGASAAVADQIGGDADNDALASPHGNSKSATVAAGSSAFFDFSAVVTETGNATNDVFRAGYPDTVTATVTPSGGWWVADAVTPASLLFSGYDTAKGGRIRVSVPCDATTGTVATTTVTLAATASNGRSLSPSSVTLTYDITAGDPAPGDCVQPPQDEPATVTIDDVGTGAEGSAIPLEATASDDLTSKADLDLTWSYAALSGVDAGATCSFGDAKAEDTTISCTDDGDYTVTLTAFDLTTIPASASATVTVTNAQPVISSASFGGANLSCGTDNATLAVAFTDAGSNDTHDVGVDWDDDGVVDETVTGATSPLSLAHTYAAGVHTATVTVTDDDGGSATSSANATVDYAMSALLQPINASGTRSLFKYGSTIPVKVRLLECDGTPALGLAPRISVQQTLSGTPTGIDETIWSTSAADTGTTLRYTGEDGLYLFNLATKALPDPTAGYRVTVTVPTTGQSTWADIGLKK